MIAEKTDLETYVVTQLRRRERPIESYFMTGAVSGSLCYLVPSLIFLCLPEVYLTLRNGGYFYFFPVNALCLLAFGGACFGVTVFWVLSISVAKLRVTFDGSRTGFYVGYLAGALFGAVVLAIPLLATNRWSFEWVMSLYTREINGSAILCGSLGAVLGSIFGGLLTRPVASAAQTPKPYFVDNTGQWRELILPFSQSDEPMRRQSEERFQFSICRILFLTAAIALMFSIPRLIRLQMMAIPALSSLANLDLILAVHSVAVSLLILPYLVWVTFRGPQAFARLACAWTQCRRRRQEFWTGPLGRDAPNP
ncbi:hypothetical protein NHH03_02820 [Stieleria sp. TO1_6]|uniref:hypothetical protein n=1 Tax=Stieleria tagensis TaxID=2956795 RepID=UPI00209A754F|nr:hypothetical protein [Stieleria tagensis]MCO8120656.1 hypothetical protein [Stieleria tagensis]